MPHDNDVNCSNRIKTHQYFLFGFLLILLIFKIPYFFLPLMASLNILCPDPPNFLKEITKKLWKEALQKFFCGSSKILKNTPWAINKCLKYFMAQEKSPQALRFTYLIYVPLRTGICFFCSSVIIMQA